MKLIIGTIIIAVFFALDYYTFNQITRPLTVPTLDMNLYWGPGDGSKYQPDPTIRTFTIRRSTNEIADLKIMLSRQKFTPPLEDVNFEYGMNTEAMQKIVEYWRDDYLPRWSDREALLNQFPQFTTEIQGLHIHYIYAKPSATDAKTKRVIPLLLLHGWSNSVRDFYEVIPMFTKATQDNDFVFEVIAPSLVGYGWSDAAAKPGFNIAQAAIVLRNLMLRIGHQKFVVQGGDWGALIGSALVTLFPENSIGFHSTTCILTTPLAAMKLFVASFYPAKFEPNHPLYYFPFLDKLFMIIKEFGYYHIQATKPDTIGAALTQNPIGMAAFYLEKFQSSTGLDINHKHNAMREVYNFDAVLDNIMIYYLSNTATSSGRYYADNIRREITELQLDRVQSPVPMACARFKWDAPAITAMDWQLKDKFPNLIHSSYFEHGGHFFHYEMPEEHYNDVVKFVAKIKFE